MQQKVLLVCKIYLFCIYFSLINFNYPKKSMAIPSKFTRGGPAGNSRRKNNTSLGFGPCSWVPIMYATTIIPGAVKEKKLMRMTWRRVMWWMNQTVSRPTMTEPAPIWPWKASNSSQNKSIPLRWKQKERCLSDFDRGHKSDVRHMFPNMSAINVGQTSLFGFSPLARVRKKWLHWSVGL